MGRALALFNTFTQALSATTTREEEEEEEDKGYHLSHVVVEDNLVVQRHID
jgi:hypothetical protein